MDRSPATIHATAVAVASRCAVITGRSGSGKSSLGLQMIGLGGVLVGDDQIHLTDRNGTLVASCPPRLRGIIEARGVGLLRARAAGTTPVACIVDLDQTEPERLPPWRTTIVQGIKLPLLYRPEGVGFAAVLFQYLRCGRFA